MTFWADYASDLPEYIEKDKRFNAWLKRKLTLESICRDKYPEIYELITTYYEAKNF